MNGSTSTHDGQVTGEPVRPLQLAVGDRIHVCHRHDTRLGPCTVGPAETEAVITGYPEQHGGRVTVCCCEYGHPETKWVLVLDVRDQVTLIERAAA